MNPMVLFAGGMACIVAAFFLKEKSLIDSGLILIIMAAAYIIKT